MYETRAKSKRKCLLCPVVINKGEEIIVFSGRGSAHKKCVDDL